jgi:hypothetical protein
MHDIGSSIDHAVPLLSSNTNRSLLSWGFSLAPVSFEQRFRLILPKKDREAYEIADFLFSGR